MLCENIDDSWTAATKGKNILSLNEICLYFKKSYDIYCKNRLFEVQYNTVSYD